MMSWSHNGVSITTDWAEVDSILSLSDALHAPEGVTKEKYCQIMRREFKVFDNQNIPDWFIIESFWPGRLEDLVTNKELDIMLG